MKYTKRQAEYVAFIYYYTKIHGRAPAEHEIMDHFRISPPSVHQMILNLEKNGLISRVAGQARSIRIVVLEDELRELKKIADF
jgi:repressor LexA